MSTYLTVIDELIGTCRLRVTTRGAFVAIEVAGLAGLTAETRAAVLAELAEVLDPAPGDEVFAPSADDADVATTVVDVRGRPDGADRFTSAVGLARVASATQVIDAYLAGRRRAERDARPGALLGVPPASPDDLRSQGPGVRAAWRRGYREGQPGAAILDSAGAIKKDLSALALPEPTVQRIPVRGSRHVNADGEVSHRVGEWRWQDWATLLAQYATAARMEGRGGSLIAFVDATAETALPCVAGDFADGAPAFIVDRDDEAGTVRRVTVHTMRHHLEQVAADPGLAEVDVAALVSSYYRGDAVPDKTAAAWGRLLLLGP